MDKNQSIIIMIIAVLIAACVFLYFVFRPDTDEGDAITEELQEKTFDISVDEDFQSTEEDLLSNSSASDDQMGYTGDMGVGTITNNTSNTSSPDTGPGAIAFGISFLSGVLALFFGRSVVKRIFA